MTVTQQILNQVTERVTLSSDQADKPDPIIDVAIDVLYDGPDTLATVQVSPAGVTLDTAETAAVFLDFETYRTLRTMSGAINQTTQFSSMLVGDPEMSSTRLQCTAALSVDPDIAPLSISESFLEYLAEGVIKQLERSINRNITLRWFSETTYASSGRVVLRNPDVDSVTLYSTQVVSGLDVEYSGTSLAAAVEVINADLILHDGPVSMRFDLLAYTSMANLAAAIAEVADWTATVRKELPPRYLATMVWSGLDDGGLCTVDVWDPAGKGQRRLQSATGTMSADAVSTFDRGFGYGGRSQYCDWSDGHPIRVDYLSGFRVLPGDIENAVVTAVSWVARTVKINPAISRERLGDYEYELNDITGAISSAVDLAAKMIATRRRILP